MGKRACGARARYDSGMDLNSVAVLIGVAANVVTVLGVVYFGARIVFTMGQREQLLMELSRTVEARGVVLTMITSNAERQAAILERVEKRLENVESTVYRPAEARG